MSNNLEADGPVKPPLKSDGSFYQFCMYFENNRSVIFSDTLENIISRLIPGYNKLGEDQKNQSRYRYCLDTFESIQTLLLQNATHESLDLAELLKPKEEASEELIKRNPNLIIVSNLDIDGTISLKYGEELDFLESLDKVNHISFFTA